MRYLVASIFLFFSIIPIAAQTSGSNDWVWQYPKPQGNTLRDIYVFNDDTAIAVGDLSTIIKTTDGGNTWVVQGNVSPSQILFSVQFIDANNGWAAGGNYLLKTNDGGKSWVQVNRDTAYGIFATYFVDSDTGFVFGANGYISRTTDGGNSWRTLIMDDYIGGYLDIFQFNAVTFTDKNTGWLVGAGYDGNEIYKTTDCGRTWTWNGQTITPVASESLNDIYFVDKNHGFAAGQDGVCLKTTDGGNTWQYKNPNTEGWTFHSVVFTDSLTGWLTASGGINQYYYSNIILKTTNGGDTWGYTADPNMAAADGLYKIRFADSNNGWMVGQDGMISRTTDAGNNWHPQRDDKHNFYSIYFIDKNTGWAVGDSGIVLHTTNGGDNWEKQYSANDLILYSIQAVDSLNVVAVGHAIVDLYSLSAVILKTNDGGQNWKSILIDSTNVLNSVCFSSPLTCWAVGGEKLKTTDGGITWQSQNYIPGGGCKHVQFINENTGWVSLYDSTLYKTTDGGNTWIQQTINANLDNVYFYFVDANIGWAVGDPYGGDNIFKTIDGGNTWTSRGITNAGNNFSIDFINETTGWITGLNCIYQQSILKTNDGGNTWTNQEIPSNSLAELQFIDGTTGWAAGTGIFKTTDGGGIAAIKGPINNGNIPKQITLNQNYPNPFNPSTIISWKLNSSSHVILKVYDILGREITTLVNENMDAGSYNISWNASKMASGVYFYRLWVSVPSGQVNSLNNNKESNFIETKKMMLIR
jgi:photosystem II stability/assembly factor-like uncharacterized protein